MGTLPQEWADALARMRRNNPVYKPAVLFAALALLDEGASPEALPLGELRARYEALLRKTSMTKPASLSQPLSALGNDRILAPDGGSTVGLAGELRASSSSGSVRAAIREHLLQMLSADGKSLSDELRRAVSENG